MPCHLCYDRLIHVAGLGHPGTCMVWDLELKFICWMSIDTLRGFSRVKLPVYPREASINTGGRRLMCPGKLQYNCRARHIWGVEYPATACGRTAWNLRERRTIPMPIVPHRAWAPSLRDSKKSGRPHRLGGMVPCRSPTVIPTATQYILYTVQVSLAGGDEYSILTASMADM